MRLALLAGGDGWHVRDVRQAATDLGHTAELLDFRKLAAGVAAAGDPFAGFDAVLVRTMPPGSLEQVVFRMDLLHRAAARGLRVVNPAPAIEACVDKYLATAKLAAAGLPVPPTVACQTADAAMDAFHALGGDVVVKPLFGSEGRGMVRVGDPELAWAQLPHAGAVAVRAVRAAVRAAPRLGRAAVRRRRPGAGGDAAARGRRLADERRPRRPGGGRDADAGRGGLGRAGRGRGRLSGGRRRSLADAGRGWAVLEVNAVPGWRALAPACGVDVAAAVVRYAVGDDDA
ncbi:MAG: 30S ribosomal protein S6--L-glutamate ligase [Gemmataceae bacterium]